MINKEHKHLLMYLSRHFLCTPSGLLAILCTALRDIVTKVRSVILN